MLALTLGVPQIARVGRPVAFTLRLTNDSDETVDACLRGREVTFDLTVLDEDGRAVWRRLEGATVPAILQIVTLAPHETIEMRETWTPGAPGRYLASAAVLSESAPLMSADVSFSVER